MNAEYSAAATNLNLTSDLCAFLANLAFDDLPFHGVHQARRGMLDYIGCALAGSGHETIGKLLGVPTGLRISVPGRVPC